jgi:hypothetical protein
MLGRWGAFPASFFEKSWEKVWLFQIFYVNLQQIKQKHKRYEVYKDFRCLQEKG